jgi:hypothetical protein
MTLTAMDVKRLICPEGQKQIKKSDGNGLFLLVKITGSKLWRTRYRFSGKYQELAFGQYPTISLSKARLIPDITDGYEKGKSPACFNASLRRRLGLWKRSM